MYIANGVAPVTDMIKQGVNVALGTDGPASNNTQDMFDTLKFAGCLHKVATLQPLAIKTDKIYKMATIDAARAMGLKDQIGSLEPGKKADVIIVDLKKAHITPVHDVLASLIYNAYGSDVDTTIVDGQILMEDGNVITLDEEKILESAQKTADNLRDRLSQFS